MGEINRKAGLALGACLIFVGHSASAQKVSNQLIVKFRTQAPSVETGAQSLLRHSGLLRDFALLTYSDAESARQAEERLSHDPAVDYVEPNVVAQALEAPPSGDSPNRPCFIPGIPSIPPACVDGPIAQRLPDNLRPELVAVPQPSFFSSGRRDPYLQHLSGLQQIGAMKLWRRARGGQPVRVALLDTGIDYNHPDLWAHLWRQTDDGGTWGAVGYDYIHGDALPYDDLGHGTHVAGIIGAVGGNGIGIAGVAPRVELMAFKFLSTAKKGTTDDAIQAISSAIHHGARIINNSWGITSESEPRALRDAVELAHIWGVLFVTAAGNEGVDIDGERRCYPAAFDLPNVISVAAVDENGSLASFSNYGAVHVHLAAPGVGILSTLPRGRYGLDSGTSMAAPFVSGAAALLWSLHPYWSHLRVRQALFEGVKQVSSLQGKVATGGILNVPKAEKRGAAPWRSRSPYSPL